MENDHATADVTAENSLALGDSFYVDENYLEAVDAYAAALLVERPSEQTVHFRALSRRSAAFFQLERYEEALEDALAAQQCFSGGVTGLRSGEGEISHKRAAVAAFQLERFEQAKDQFASAAQLAALNHRDDATYREWINRCDVKLNPPLPVKESPSKPAATLQKPAPQANAPPVSPGVEARSTLAAAPTYVAPTSSVASLASPKRPTMPKYQYYQSDTVMTIAIMESNVKEEDLQVDIQPQRLTVRLTKGGVDFTVIAGNLYDKVDVSKCKLQIRDEKVLLKLRKVSAHEWHELFSKKAVDDDVATSSKVIPETEVPVVDTSKPRPYVSHRDWDKIETSLKEQEKNEIPEGDEALNKLFRDIYSKADENTRRAMTKSFQTSGGTVLSTNWDEVAKKDYEKERTAPKSMEWKNWEGEKLPTVDD
jgi:suppressor of G2 allele of SKP1